MSRLFKTLLIGMLLVTGVVFSFSCAKKTSGPSSTDIFEQFSNCNWFVYLAENEPIEVQYESSTPLTEIPALELTINGTICDFDPYNYGDDYWALFYFTYPNQIIPGQTYQVALKVNGNTKTASVVMVYPVTITVAPETFDHAQAQTFGWELERDSNYQFVYLWWDTEDDYNEKNPQISSSARQYIVTVNTVPADWRYIDFQINQRNITITDKTAFLACSGDYRYYWDNSISSRVARKDLPKHHRMFMTY